MIVIGTKAPAFTLLDQDEKSNSLEDYEGKWVILYFYPKDDTPGCTVEALGMRDIFLEFKKADAVVLGVSPDSTKSHKKFAEKFDLNFPLLADTEKKVAEVYGVWGNKKFMGREYMGILRTTFLIDGKGVVQKVYENVKTKGHAEAILADLLKLR